MATLWDKGYELDAVIARFTVGNDYELDGQLVASDCMGSMAHARMLLAIGILSDADAAALTTGLLGILESAAAGRFTVQPSDEDCHTAIENALVAAIGDAGKRIHTGRSRNDQVATVIRLFTKRRLLEIRATTLDLVRQIVDFARAHRDVPMPGRTHTQIAMPSSVGLWAMAYAEELLDLYAVLLGAWRLNDQCPLGSSAGYGAPLPLDRAMTSELLGFDHPQHNVLYASNGRGKIEAVVVDSLEYLCLTLSKLAQDLILFSLPELGYFQLPARLCSGSSIMPQKKNPDGLELLRSRSAVVGGWAQQIKSIIRSLPSGYNRDFQDTKEPLLRALATTQLCIEVATITMRELIVDPEKLHRAMVGELYATDRAFELVEAGMSFRDAYRQVGTRLEAVEALPFDSALRRRQGIGNIGNLGIERTVAVLEEHTRRLEIDSETFAAVRSNLIGDFDV